MSEQVETELNPYENSFLKAANHGIKDSYIILEDVEFKKNIGNHTDLVGKTFKNGIIAVYIFSGTAKVEMYTVSSSGIIEESLLRVSVPLFGE